MQLHAHGGLLVSVGEGLLLPSASVNEHTTPGHPMLSFRLWSLQAFNSAKSTRVITASLKGNTAL